MRAIPDQCNPRESFKLANAAIACFFAASAEARDGTRGQARGQARDEAEHHLRAVLADSSLPRRHRLKASFLLGGLLLTDHEFRCSKPASPESPCPAAAELPGIVEIVAVAGSPDDAQGRYLHLYALALDKLQSHTDDLADIDRAIVWLGRAAAQWGSPPADRRQARLLLGVQYSKRADKLVAGGCQPEPGSDSWKAYTEAIDQLERVLAKASGPARKSDQARDDDRLDASLELIIAYQHRAGEGTVPLAQLEVLSGVARQLIATMTPDFTRRSKALGNAGSVLLDRIAKSGGIPADGVLNAIVELERIDMLAARFREVPQFENDLNAAVLALSQAAGLEEHGSQLQPLFAMLLGSAHVIRYLVHFKHDDILEVGRIARIVLGRPDIKDFYRRMCAEYLWVALAAGLRKDGHLRELGGQPTSPGRPLNPTAAADFDMLLTLLGRYVVEESGLADKQLAAAFALLTVRRAEAQITDTELADAYARLQDDLTSYAGVPTIRATMSLQTAVIGASWVRRGTAPAQVAAEVAAMFDQAAAALPRGHSLAREIAAQAAGFAQFQRTGQPVAPPAGQPVAPPAGQPVARPTGTAPTEPLRLERDAPVGPPEVDLRAAALIGAPSQGRLAARGGRIIELLRPLTSPLPPDPGQRASVRCVLALALHDRWLRERASADLALAIDHVATSSRELAKDHPLRRRLDELLAGLLLDRCLADGSYADADAATEILRDLLAEATGPPPDDLNVLLAQGIGQISHPATGLRPDALLADFFDAKRIARAFYLGDLRSMLGSALLVRPVAAANDSDLTAALAALNVAARDLPSSHHRYPDTVSDLALAQLLDARRRGDSDASQEAVEAMVAATGCPDNHPRRPAILLRAAGALMAAQRAGDLNVAIDLLGQALKTAGLNSFGERSRCLYGLGHALLSRYRRTGSQGDLDEAIAKLEEARTSVLSVPGDPLLIPLLRILALAYRSGGAGLRHRQSLSAARSLLHEHARAVLIQSGSDRGLAAARRIGADTVRLVDWCLQDRDGTGAVEALELGRGLVLHSATVAADVPRLLRDQGLGDLAQAWERAVRPDSGGPVGHVPGDLRSRVLSALAGSPAELRLVSAPTMPDITAALAAGRIDALVYLIPASAETAGRALIVSPDGQICDPGLPELTLTAAGPLARYLAVNRPLDPAGGREFARLEPTVRERDQAIGDLADWAWTAALEPLLRHLSQAGHVPAAGPEGQAGLPRLAIAPVGALGAVPWHAARRKSETGPLRYACADAVFSTCASARQLIEAASRDQVAAERPRVFVANPSDNLPWAGLEADSLCAVLYPGAVHLGLSEQAPVSGPGSPAEVLAYLPGGAASQEAGLLHLGCHALAAESPGQSRLQLGGADLTLSEILAQAQVRGEGRLGRGQGGLVILSACSTDVTVTDHDEALTLASAFMAAGASGVIGSRWTVPDYHTALLMYVLHHHLVNHPELSPAQALRAAQLWMLDPDRQPPPGMPDVLARRARSHAAANPIAWAAFTCHGL